MEFVSRKQRAMYGYIYAHACIFIMITSVDMFLLQVQSGTTESGSDCSSSVSCLPAPWCKRVKDSNGCMTCKCGQRKQKLEQIRTERATQKTPYYPMFGSHGSFGFPGFPSFSGQMGPVNPMAAMFGGSSMSGGGNSPMSGPMGFGLGGMGSMGGMAGMGGHMNPMLGLSSLSGQHTTQNGTKCDPAPYTCPAPPPWCQRVLDETGCTKCYCGDQLESYYNKIQGKSNESSTISQTNVTTMTTTMIPSLATPKTTGATVLTTTPAPPLGKPCLANFFCTLDCRTGYQTNTVGCPVCKCNSDGTQDLVTQASSIHVTTLAPTSMSTTTSPVSVSGSTSGGSIVCPGIFDCVKQCSNGYEVDGQGCPLCKCIP